MMKKTWTLSLLPLVAVALIAAACRSGGEEDGRAPSDSQAGPTPPKSIPASQGATALSDVTPPAVTPKDSAAPPTTATIKAEIGQPAPSFVLKDLNGKEHSLAQYKGKTVVLEWFSPACPTCKRAYAEGPLDTMPERYVKDGMVWLSINSEAPTNKAASVEANRKFVDKYKMQAPLLFDPTGVVGRSYGAKTTPHMYVIDPQGVLIYRGALDNAPSGKTDDGTPVVSYIDAAVADLKAGQPVKVAETKSYG